MMLYIRTYLARLNLEKVIFKPKNKSIYCMNDHLLLIIIINLFRADKYSNLQ